MEKEIATIQLPLLIVRETVVLPNITLSIGVGRPISTKAVYESRNNYESMIFVTSQLVASKDDVTPQDVYNYGSLCRISSFRDNNGSISIRVKAKTRVKFTEIFEEDGMFFAKGFNLESEYLDEVTLDGYAKQLKSRLSQINLLEFFRTSDGSPARFDSNFFDLVYTIVQFSNVEPSMKRNLLSINSPAVMFEKANEILDLQLVNIQMENKINEDVRASSEAQQKDYFLRERMKAIKKEMNGNDNADADDIREKLRNGNYPENVKKKVENELKKQEMMPGGSLEASLIQSYIDVLLSVPWTQKTEDNDDLGNVRKILDEDHYGLEKVKKRIIEYLAVKQMTGNLKAPILCFYGPPGCGKTSLGRSIARALGRKFVKCSLGGVSDEAEIRGHRRTYVGSMPGRIIASMRKAGVNNPVFLLDEIDKLGSSYKGDPSSAMLEVLDPEQNFAFNDNYLEEPYDLSNVLFICTANYLENVPAPLRDRLELIEVSSYTALEKLQIAKEHLVPKQIQLNGLKLEQVEFNDEAIDYIIEHYTREAGVRSLERAIASVLRKIVVKFVEGEIKDKIVVTPKEVSELLGTEIFDSSKKEKAPQVGVVTGLAYTEYGGDILPIEVTHFNGRGSLILTGHLGDVMKESATIALGYVRANADKYNIDSKIFSSDDIHIHVPEGAVPKDGPSAGVAITTAIISCLSKTPVDANVAMTGEVTLRGNALPIGGLREKSLAAMRAGIKTIIVPKDNKKNVDELPHEVKENMNIVLMECVDDALKVALKGND